MKMSEPCEQIKSLITFAEGPADIARLASTAMNIPYAQVYGTVTSDHERRDYAFFSSLVRDIAAERVIESGVLEAPSRARKIPRARKGAAAAAYISQKNLEIHAINQIRNSTQPYTFQEMRSFSQFYGIVGDYGEPITRRGPLLRKMTITVGRRLLAGLMTQREYGDSRY